MIRPINSRRRFDPYGIAGGATGGTTGNGVVVLDPFGIGLPGGVMGFVPGGVVLPLPPVLPPFPPVQGGEPGGVPEQLRMLEKVVPMQGLMMILGGLRVLGGLMTTGGFTLGGGNLTFGGGGHCQ